METARNQKRYKCLGRIGKNPRRRCKRVIVGKRFCEDHSWQPYALLIFFLVSVIPAIISYITTLPSPNDKNHISLKEIHEELLLTNDKYEKIISRVEGQKRIDTKEIVDLIKKGKLKKTKKLLDSEIQANEESLKYLSSLFYFKGAILFQETKQGYLNIRNKDKLVDAIEFFEKALSIDEDNIPATEDLAVCYGLFFILESGVISIPSAEFVTLPDTQKKYIDNSIDLHKKLICIKGHSIYYLRLFMNYFTKRDLEGCVEVVDNLSLSGNSLTVKEKERLHSELILMLTFFSLYESNNLDDKVYRMLNNVLKLNLPPEYAFHFLYIVNNKTTFNNKHFNILKSDYLTHYKFSDYQVL